MKKMVKSIVKKSKEVLAKTAEKIEEVIVNTVSSLENVAVTTYNKVEEVKSSVKETSIKASQKVEDVKNAVCTKVVSSIETTKESITSVFCTAKGKASELKTAVMTIKVEAIKQIKSKKDLTIAQAAEIKSRLIFNSVNFKNTCIVKIDGFKRNLVYNMYVLRELLIQAHQRSYDGHIVNGKSEYEIAGINVLLKGLKKVFALKLAEMKQEYKDLMSNIYQQAVQGVIESRNLIKNKTRSFIVNLHLARERFITSHLLSYDGYVVVDSEYKAVSTMNIIELAIDCMKKRCVLTLDKIKNIVLETPRIPVIYYNKLGELIESNDREFFKWREAVITTNLSLGRDYGDGVQSPSEDILLDARIFASNSSVTSQNHSVSELCIDTA